MAQWATFAGITGVVLVLLLVLSYLTQTAFSDATDSTASDDVDSDPTAVGSGPRGDDRTPRSEGDTAADRDRAFPSGSTEHPDTRPSVGGDGSADTPADETDTRPAVDGELEGGASEPDDPTAEREASSGIDPAPALDGPTDAGPVSAESTDDRPPAAAAGRHQPAQLDPDSLSTGELLANVAISQGLFALVLIGAAIYTGIPADALGIEYSVAALERGLWLGTAVGLALYVANEIGAAAVTRFGFDHDEQLRELLAPDSLRGWLVLLVFVLPIIAGFEELLFRAAVIGAVSTGFAVDPWLLAVVSSVAFAIGHGMQGSVGIVVTGILGFVLAAIFIVTGSLLVVVVAHYLINALEFVVHEGVGFDWAETLET